MRKPNKLSTLLIIIIALVLAISCSSSPNTEPHFSPDWTYNEAYHWHKSTDKGSEAISAIAKHEFKYVKSDEGDYQECLVCGYQLHYSTDWSTDDSYHWHKSTDKGSDAVMDRAKHTLKYIATESGHYQECSVCGYKTEEVSHSLEFIYNSATHYQKCDICGYTTKTEDHKLSDWYFNEKRTQRKRECNVCKFEIDEEITPVTTADEFIKAFSNLGECDTIVLFDDMTLSQTIEISKDISIDLNSHVVTSSKRVFEIKAGTLFLDNGTIKYTEDSTTSSAIHIDSSIGYSGLDIAKDASIFAENSFGITAYEENNRKADIVVNGLISSKYSCISDKHGKAYSNFKLTTTINEGATLKSDSASITTGAIGYPTIYQTNNSSLFINGGNIVSGNGSAIEIRAGQVIVTDGNFVSNADTYTKTNSDSQPTVSGAAFAVSYIDDSDRCLGPTYVYVTKATFTSKNMQLSVVNLTGKENLEYKVNIGSLVTLDESKVDAKNNGSGDYTPKDPS